MPLIQGRTKGGYWGVQHPQVHYIMQYSENSILLGNLSEVMKYCADEIDLGNVIEKLAKQHARCI